MEKENDDKFFYVTADDAEKLLNNYKTPYTFRLLHVFIVIGCLIGVIVGAAVATTASLILIVISSPLWIADYMLRPKRDKNENIQ